MNRRGIAIWIALLGALATIALMAGEAAAQYPNTIGAVIVASGNTAPGPNETVPVTATVVDEEGNAIAGATCTFSIATQLGTDASVEAGPFTTNSDGEVSTTLHSGSTGGNITVAASCQLDGEEVTAQTAVVVTGAGEAAPPASLPDTGGGSGDGGDLGLMWAFAVAGGVLALGGLSIAGLAWRRARS